MPSIICLKGIPPKWTKSQVLRVLRRIVDGNFKLFEFVNTANSKKINIRVPADVDSSVLIQGINNATYGNLKLMASFVQTSMLINLTNVDSTPKLNAWHNIFISTHTELLRELQLRFMGLNDLSENIKESLFESIGWAIFGRLKTIVESNPGVPLRDHFLSRQYRKAYPHFGDFQFILSSLHALEDSAGDARTQIVASELAYVRDEPFMVFDVPYSKVKEAYVKYSDRVIKKVSERLNSLKMEIDSSNPTEEEIARKKVREALKKLIPALPSMVKQVVLKNLIPHRQGDIKMYVYTDWNMLIQSLPGQLQRLAASPPVKLRHLHYAAELSVSHEHYQEIMKLNETVHGGLVITIRPDVGGCYSTSAKTKDAAWELFNIKMEDTKTHDN